MALSVRFGSMVGSLGQFVKLSHFSEQLSNAFSRFEDILHLEPRLSRYMQEAAIPDCADLINW